MSAYYRCLFRKHCETSFAFICFSSRRRLRERGLQQCLQFRLVSRLGRSVYLFNCLILINYTVQVQKNSGLSLILHHDLHWLDVPQRVIFKLCMTVYKCLHGLAPKYLAKLCVPVADVAGRRQLRSASRGLLNFPRYNVSNYGRRAFCFAGHYDWNSLPEHIRQSTAIAVFKRSLETFLLQQMSHLAH